MPHASKLDPTFDKLHQNLHSDLLDAHLEKYDSESFLQLYALESAVHKSAPLQNLDCSSLEDISAGNLKVPATEITCNSIKAKLNHSDTYLDG